MRAIRLIGLTLVLVAIGGTWAQSAAADDAAAIYDPSAMWVIKLTLPGPSKAALEDPEKWEDYQPGKFSAAVSADGNPAHVGAYSPQVDVGIRLKGSYTFRNLSAKSAFKIKFAKTELFHGLRVLTLNNMVADPSMIRETLAYTAFRGADVPASRTGYAYVYVNDEDYGIHLNIETVDRIALEKLLGPFNEETQHLYEGEDADDVHPGMAEEYEVDEGDEEDLSDLEALIEAVNSSGPETWAERVESVIDLEEMTMMWAVEKYVGQWDGYAGQEESWMPNNYYLYSDPDGRFQMLPWSTDEALQMHHRVSFEGPAGLMFDLCLDDEACAAIYRKSVAAVHKEVAGMDLDALAVKTAALLAPWQKKEVEAEDTRAEYTLEGIKHGVGEVREFIALRPAEAAEWLGSPTGTEPSGSTPAPAGSTASPAEAPGPAGPPTPSLRVGKTWMTGGILRSQARLRTSGVVTLRATVSTGKGALVFCRTRLQITRPRSLVLACRLPAAVRERLRRGSLDVTVATRFLPVGGVLENIARRITLPRT